MIPLGAIYLGKTVLYILFCHCTDVFLLSVSLTQSCCFGLAVAKMHTCRTTSMTISFRMDAATVTSINIPILYIKES